VSCIGSDACRKLGHLDANIQKLQSELLSVNNRLGELEMDRSSLDTDLQRVEATHGDKQREYQLIFKDFEYAKERETAMRVDRWSTHLYALFLFEFHVRKWVIK